MKRDKKTSSLRHKKKKIRLDSSDVAELPIKKLKAEAKQDLDLKGSLSQPEVSAEDVRRFIAVATNSEEDEDAVAAVEKAIDAYLDSSRELFETFRLLEKWSKKNSELKLAVELIDLLLLRLLTRKADEDEGSTAGLQLGLVSKRLLQEHSPSLYKSLDNKNAASQIKATLRILTTTAAQGPTGVKIVLDHLDLTHPAFPPLLDRRDRKDPEDVRRRFVLLLAGLLVNGDAKSIERLLELKGFVQGFVSGLLYDRAQTISLALTVMKERILENSAVSKTHKVKVFHERTLIDLSSLLRWKPGVEPVRHKWSKEAKRQSREQEANDDDGSDDTLDEETNHVREAAFDFLQQLLTNVRLGIAFKPEYEGVRFSSNVNPNHLVTAFLKNLSHPFTDVTNRRLALRILISLPDQVPHFFQFYAHVLVARPTELFFSAMTFLVELLESLSVVSCSDVASYDQFSKDEALDRSDLLDRLVDSCVPRLATANHNVVVAGLKHERLEVVSSTLGLLEAVVVRAVKISEVLQPSIVKPFSREISSLLPLPSLLVASSSLQNARITEATKEREGFANLIKCLDRFLRLLSSWSRLDALFLVEEDCTDIYRILSMTSAICGGEGVKEDVSEAAISTLRLHLMKLLSVNSAILPNILKSPLAEDDDTRSSLLKDILLSATKGGPDSAQYLKLLIKTLTSQIYFENAEAELGIWFRHLAEIEDVEVIDLLEKSIVKLLNHPYPFLDRVMDLQAEAESEGILGLDSDAASESASVASADTIVDAIISVDALEDDDTNVLLSSIDSELISSQTIDDDRAEPRLDTSLALPFSPLIIAVTSHSENVSKGHNVQSYISKVVVDLYHTQNDGNALEIFLRGEIEKNNELFLPQILSYVNSISSGLLEFLEEATELKSLVLFLQSLKFEEKNFDSISQNDLLKIGFESSFHIRKIIYFLTTRYSEHGHGVLVKINTKILLIFKILKKCLERINWNTGSSECNLLLKRIFDKENILKWFLNAEYVTFIDKEYANSLIYSISCEISRCISSLPYSMIKDSAEPFVKRTYEVLTQLESTNKPKLFKESLMIASETFLPFFDNSQLLGLTVFLCDSDMLQLTTKKGDSIVISGFGKIFIIAGNLLAERHLIFPFPAISSLENLLTSLSNNIDNEKVYLLLKKSLDAHPSLACLLQDSLINKLWELKHYELLLSIFDFSSTRFTNVAQLKFIIQSFISENIKLESWHIKLIKTYFTKASGENAIEDMASLFLKYVLQNDGVLKQSSELKPLFETTIPHCKADIINELCSLSYNLVSEHPSNSSCVILFYEILVTDQVAVSEAKLVDICLVFLQKLLESTESNRTSLENFYRHCNVSLKSLLQVDDILFDKEKMVMKLIRKTLKYFLKSADALTFIDLLIQIMIALGENKTLLNENLSRIFSMILFHSEFKEALLSPENEVSKAALVALAWRIMPYASLETLTDIDQTKITEILLSAYNATLSETDQKILNILSRFDLQIGPLKPQLWGKELIELQSLNVDTMSLWKQEITMEMIVNALDVEIMNNTVKDFPLFRMLNAITQGTYLVKKTHLINLSKMYDPAFILPVLFQFLQGSQVINCKNFILKRCLSFIFMACSSHFESVRLLAYGCLARFSDLLEGTRFAERDLFKLLFNVLKNSIPKPAARLPCIFSVFLAKSSVILLNPEDDMYSDICNFILLKPVMNIWQIPEYYRLFNSTNPIKAPSDRLWIMELMRDGLKESWDFKIFEKRQAIRTILSYLFCPLSRSINIILTGFEILERALLIRPAAVELILEANFFTYLNSVSTKVTNVSPSFANKIANLYTVLWFTLIKKEMKNEKMTYFYDNYSRSLIGFLPNAVHCDVKELTSFLSCLCDSFEIITPNVLDEKTVSILINLLMRKLNIVDTKLRSRIFKIVSLWKPDMLNKETADLIYKFANSLTQNEWLDSCDVWVFEWLRQIFSILPKSSQFRHLKNLLPAYFKLMETLVGISRTKEAALCIKVIEELLKFSQKNSSVEIETIGKVVKLLSF